MIDRWWQPEFLREPALDDLPDAEKRAVLAAVASAKLRIDRIAGGVLAGWLAASVIGLVVLCAVDGVASPPIISWAWWILVPAYVSGWRTNAVRKATRRAVIRTVRRHRLDEIDTIIARR